MSEALKGALIIGQSGGPSSVINSSAYGCIRTALDADCITKVYGAYHGIKGVLNDELLCMQIIEEGVLAIADGSNPRYIQEKLEFMLPASKKRSDKAGG